MVSQGVWHISQYSVHYILVCYWCASIKHLLSGSFDYVQLSAHNFLYIWKWWWWYLPCKETTKRPRMSPTQNVGLKCEANIIVSLSTKYYARYEPDCQTPRARTCLVRLQPAREELPYKRPRNPQTSYPYPAYSRSIAPDLYVLTCICLFILIPFINWTLLFIWKFNLFQYPSRNHTWMNSTKASIIIIIIIIWTNSGWSEKLITLFFLDPSQ